MACATGRFLNAMHGSSGLEPAAGGGRHVAGVCVFEAEVRTAMAIENTTCAKTGCGSSYCAMSGLDETASHVDSLPNKAGQMKPTVANMA